MRTVIYDSEALEPLTVIDIPQHFARTLKNGDIYNVPVPPKLISVMAKSSDAVPEMVSFKVVRLRFEPIYKGRGSVPMLWLCTTQDAESALELRATFLPGQRGEMNRQLEAAFLKGLFAALS